MKDEGRTHLLIAATGILLVAACVLAYQEEPRPNWGTALLLAACGVLAEWSSIQAEGASRISLSSILLFASVPLVGPLGAALVGFCSVALVPRRQPMVARTFNSLMIALVGAVAGLLLPAFRGSLIDHSTSVFDLVVLCLPQMLLVSLVIFALNILMLSLIIAMNGRSGFRAALSALVREHWYGYVTSGLIAYLVVILWKPGHLGALALLVMLTPMLMERWAFEQQAAERVAQERTLAGLVALAEARDPAMVGHSARVASVSRTLGARMRLTHRELVTLWDAALLHDIGLVAPRPRASDADSLRQAEIERILAHPVRGIELTANISFLAEVHPIIKHHHERWDGRGYPDGLVGTRIPRLSRVIAVADAFCALTDPHRGSEALTASEAIGRIEETNGIFDPIIVSVLREVAGRLEELVMAMVPVAPIPAGQQQIADHDLPQSSDELAALRGHPV